jgi:hypothetical protein
MPVSSTAAASLALTRARRKKPQFFAVTQELIAFMLRPRAPDMLDCA